MEAMLKNQSIDGSSSATHEYYKSEERAMEAVSQELELKRAATQAFLKCNSMDHMLITTNKKILIVDDSSFNIDALYVILKFTFNINTEAVCRKAFNGQEAVDIIK